MNRIDEILQGRCGKDIPECEGSSSPSYFLRLKVSNSGQRDYKSKIVILGEFASKHMYAVKQASVTSANSERKVVSFQIGKDESNIYFF